jgi:hypothetical protein
MNTQNMVTTTMKTVFRCGVINDIKYYCIEERDSKVFLFENNFGRQVISYSEGLKQIKNENKNVILVSRIVTTEVKYNLIKL